MRRYGSGIQIAPTGWLGLAWVYSGILWLLPAWLGWSAGSLELALLALVRVAATVAVGVGICANERWGWATALALAVVYIAWSVGLGVLVLSALWTRPEGALSWQPVLWGLTARQCNALLTAAGAVALVSLAAVALLWSARGGFDVPHRRVYGTIVRFGLGPALGILLVDGALLIGWW